MIGAEWSEIEAPLKTARLVGQSSDRCRCVGLGTIFIYLFFIYLFFIISI
jgi:hypothetical protein